MSEMRKALEQIKALTEIPFAHTAGDHELIYVIATEALAKQPTVPEYDSNAYEELRAIIDGGSESMTHSDAVEWCKRHAESDWKPVKAVELTDAEIDEVYDDIPTIVGNCVKGYRFRIARAVIAAHEAKKEASK